MQKAPLSAFNPVGQAAAVATEAAMPGLQETAASIVSSLTSLCLPQSQHLGLLAATSMFPPHLSKKIFFEKKNRQTTNSVTYTNFLLLLLCCRHSSEPEAARDTRDPGSTDTGRRFAGEGSPSITASSNDNNSNTNSVARVAVLSVHPGARLR